MTKNYIAMFCNIITVSIYLMFNVK